MADQIPEGAIPEEQFQAMATPQVNRIPAGAIPEEEFNQSQYGTPIEQAKTAIEQGLSGATLGASKVLETQGVPALGIPPITTPEAIAGREAANPVTATVSNIAGTTGLALVSGGAGFIPEAATVAGRIGVGAALGAGIGGVNQVTDDWSQNKPLDAQKIAAATGLGALLGGTGAALAEGISAAVKPKAIASVPTAVSEQAAEAQEAVAKANAPVDSLPKEVTGVQPTSYDEIAAVNEAAARRNAVPLGSQTVLDDALSRTPLENPINPLQRAALGSEEASNIYLAAKESPGELGANLTNYERLQKAELVQKTSQTIKDIAPATDLTSDAYEGGKLANSAFTKQYKAEQEALAPVFNAIKKLPYEGDILPDAIESMTQSVPGIANMFDIQGEELSIRPYKTAWGIDKSTYQAVKEAVESLQTENNSLQTLWNVRKGLDQHVDVLAQGQAPAEIRALKASLMTQMQEGTGDPNIREAFKRYAINEQQRQVIENSFGASVGSKEFGQISKVKPEMIGDRIFGNTATVQAAKNILPEQQFKTILANWILENQEAATDKGTFSSNKFQSFLRRNQDALNVAFHDQPETLQRLRDLTTISRIIPDAPSINPSGTAKTLSRMILGADLKDFTWEQMLASIPKKIASEISDRLKMRELNQYLSGQAVKNSQTAALKTHVESISSQIDQGIKALFAGSASESRKANGK